MYVSDLLLAAIESPPSTWITAIQVVIVAALTSPVLILIVKYFINRGTTKINLTKQMNNLVQEQLNAAEEDFKTMRSDIKQLKDDQKALQEEVSFFKRMNNELQYDILKKERWYREANPSYNENLYPFPWFVVSDDKSKSYEQIDELAKEIEDEE